MIIYAHISVILLLILSINADIVVGIDFGAENAHAVLLGDEFRFHVLQTQSGKRSFPALSSIGKNRRFNGEEALSMVCYFL